MPIAPLPLVIVIRSVLSATGAEAATSRSGVGERIVMNTAALAVPPTVSRVHTSFTSGGAGCAQAVIGNNRNRAKASRLTSISLAFAWPPHRLHARPNGTGRRYRTVACAIRRRSATALPELWEASPIAIFRHRPRPQCRSPAAAARRAWRRRGCGRGDPRRQVAFSPAAAEPLTVGGLAVTCNLTLPVACAANEAANPFGTSDAAQLAFGIQQV